MKNKLLILFFLAGFYLASGCSSHSSNLEAGVDDVIQSGAIAGMHSLYSYQHTTEENIQLRLSVERQKAVIRRLIVLSVVLVVVMIGVFCYLRFIQENALKVQLALSQKELLESDHRKIQILRSEQERLLSSFEQSDIYLTFHKVCNDPELKITDNQWKELQLSIDEAYPHFTDRLYSLYPKLSLSELRICCLIKISMPKKDIARLTNSAKSTVSTCRSRLYEKMHGTKGSAKMFDEFLIDL